MRINLHTLAPGDGTFRRRRFGDAVSATDYSAMDVSATGTFRRWVFSAIVLFDRDTSATGRFGDESRFGDGTFRRWDVSAIGRFGDGTFRRWYVSAMGHFGDRMFWQWDVSAMRCFAGETFRRRKSQLTNEVSANHYITVTICHIILSF